MKDAYELAIRFDTCRIIYRGDRDKLEKIRKTYDEIEKGVAPESANLNIDCIAAIEVLNEDKEVTAYLLPEKTKKVAERKASIIDEVKEWVKTNYNPAACGWTAERSFGNCDDCFYDGQESGASYAAYKVGQILGMVLEEPNEPGTYSEEYL